MESMGVEGEREKYPLRLFNALMEFMKMGRRCPRGWKLVNGESFIVELILDKIVEAVYVSNIDEKGEHAQEVFGDGFFVLHARAGAGAQNFDDLCSSPKLLELRQRDVVWHPPVYTISTAVLLRQVAELPCKLPDLFV